MLGWGVKGMTVVIKAFLSEEPLEGDDSEGSWEKKLPSPYFLAAFTVSRPSATDVYQRELKRGLAGWGQGRLRTQTESLLLLHYTLKTLKKR